MTKPPISEEQVQSTIIEGLTALGYLVLQTTVRVKNATCPACHRSFRPFGGYGATKGVPDLLITRHNWPWGAMLALEIKKPIGWKWSGHDQKELWETERTMVATSWEQACFAVWAFERFSLNFRECLVLAIEREALRLPLDDRQLVAHRFPGSKR